MSDTKTPITRDTFFKDRVTFRFSDFSVNVEAIDRYAWIEKFDAEILLETKSEIKNLIRCLKLCLKEIKQDKEVRQVEQVLAVGAFDPLQGKE